MCNNGTNQPPLFLHYMLRYSLLKGSNLIVWLSTTVNISINNNAKNFQTSRSMNTNVFIATHGTWSKFRHCPVLVLHPHGEIWSCVFKCDLEKHDLPKYSKKVCIGKKNILFLWIQTWHNVNMPPHLLQYAATWPTVCASISLKCEETHQYI